MQCEDSESDIAGYNCVIQTMKGKKYGRMNVSKKLNLQSHTPGPDCTCNELKCFGSVPESARNNIARF